MDVKEAQIKLWNDVNKDIVIYRTTQKRCKIFRLKNEEIISDVVRENVDKIGLNKLGKLIASNKISGEILEKINKEGEVISEKTLTRMKNRAEKGFGYDITNSGYKTTLDLLAFFIGYIGFDNYISEHNTESDINEDSNNEDGQNEPNINSTEIEIYTHKIIVKEEKMREFLQINFRDALWHVDYGRIADHTNVRLMDNIDTVAAKFTEFWNQYIVKKEKMNSERYKAWIKYDKDKYDNSIYIRKYIYQNLGLFFDVFFEELGIDKEKLSEEKSYFDSIDQESSKENLNQLKKIQSKEKIAEYTGKMLVENMNLIKELEEKYPLASRYFRYDEPVSETDKKLLSDIKMVCTKITNFWVLFIYNKKQMDSEEYKAWINFVKNLYSTSTHIRNYIKIKKKDFTSVFYSELGINKEEL